MRTSLSNILGLAAIAFYGAHGIHSFQIDETSNLFWLCNLGTLFSGLGLSLRNKSLIGVGVLWLCLGNLIWLPHVLTGGATTATSVISHLGGISVGIFAALTVGIRPRSWLLSLIALPFLWLACRLATPEKANLNMAFRIEDGYERYISSYGLFLATCSAIAAVVFFVGEASLTYLRQAISKANDSN